MTVPTIREAQPEEGSSGLVVHENFGPWKYTTIHRRSCSFARPGGHQTRNTRWYPRGGGVYAAYADARAAAEACDQPNGPSDCRVCSPRSSRE